MGTETNYSVLQVLFGGVENITNVNMRTGGPRVLLNLLFRTGWMRNQVLEKMNEQHQNGPSEIKSKTKKERKGNLKVGSSSELGISCKSAPRQYQKIKSFSDSAQLAGMSPDTIFNEAQK